MKRTKEPIKELCGQPYTERRVQDSRGQALAIGDRVQSVTRVPSPSDGRLAKLGATRPERTGLVIDLLPSSLTARSQVRIELDDDELSEITSPSIFWLKVGSEL